jgi:hypothetical protein
MGYLQSKSQRRSRSMKIGMIVSFLSAVMSVGSAQTVVPHHDEFVQHDGARLTLGGEAFRYSGSNIEWLGIENYGPSETMGPRYPTHFETDDVLDTAKLMGARVIRAQTLGDSVAVISASSPSRASSILKPSSPSITPLKQRTTAAYATSSLSSATALTATTAASASTSSGPAART